MNTNEQGRVSEAKVLARLVEMGKHVLVPFSNIGRYDLLIDEGNGKYIRIECKTGRFRKGCVVFNTISAGYTSTGKRRPERGYSGDADYFGVWCPDTQEAYMIPVEEAPKSSMMLRVEPPSNGHKQHINWAKDYKL